MSEPTTTTAATAIVTGATITGLIAGIDAGVFIGAFAGSVIFVLSAGEFSIYKKLAFFVMSFFAGLLSANFVAAIMTAITPDGVFAERPLGALVGAAVAVRLLIFLSTSAKNPIGFLSSITRSLDKFTQFLDKFNGGKND